MKAIDNLRAHIDGPGGDRCRGFVLKAKTKQWVRHIERACIATDVNYTMMNDPEIVTNVEFFITGTKRQLQALVTLLETKA